MELRWPWRRSRCRFEWCPTQDTSPGKTIDVSRLITQLQLSIGHDGTRELTWARRMPKQFHSPKITQTKNRRRWDANYYKHISKQIDYCATYIVHRRCRGPLSRTWSTREFHRRHSYPDSGWICWAVREFYPIREARTWFIWICRAKQRRSGKLAIFVQSSFRYMRT